MYEILLIVGGAVDCSEWRSERWSDCQRAWPKMATVQALAIHFGSTTDAYHNPSSSKPSQGHRTVGAIGGDCHLWLSVSQSVSQSVAHYVKSDPKSDPLSDHLQVNPEWAQKIPKRIPKTSPNQKYNKNITMCLMTFCLSLAQFEGARARKLTATSFGSSSLQCLY